MLRATPTNLGRHNRYGTRKYFFQARSTAFWTRLPITRIQRSLTLEYIKNGRMKPWYYRKEQVLGAPAALLFDYEPRPVRLVGTVMDTFGHQSSTRGGLKVYARSEGTNMMLWVPMGNPKIKAELTAAEGSFSQFLAERDKWDEAYNSGRARLY
jgi:hypothetical protein